MNTKLTLSLNQQIIEKAKAYAKSQDMSLSNLIENYLHSLTQTTEKEPKISSLVENLTGVIPSQSDEMDKKEYYDYLEKKYS